MACKQLEVAFGFMFICLVGGPVVKDRVSIMTRERERTIAHRSEVDVENS